MLTKTAHSVPGAFGKNSNCRTEAFVDERGTRPPTHTNAKIKHQNRPQVLYAQHRRPRDREEAAWTWGVQCRGGWKLPPTVWAQGKHATIDLSFTWRRRSVARRTIYSSSARRRLFAEAAVASLRRWRGGEREQQERRGREMECWHVKIRTKESAIAGGR